MRTGTQYQRFELLDLLRGIAILSVIVAHASEILLQSNLVFLPSSKYTSAFLNIFREGLVGVQVFFCISGYCIASSLNSLIKKEFNPFISFFIFIWRRIKRIYPPYLFCLLIFFVIFLCFSYLDLKVNFHNRSILHLDFLSFLGNLTLTETLRPYLFGGQSYLFLPHAWSLCYEMQFYVAFSLFTLSFKRYRFSATILILLVWIFFSFYVIANNVSLKGIFIDRNFFPFLIGSLCFYFINYLSQTFIRLLVFIFLFSFILFYYFYNSFCVSGNLYIASYFRSVYVSCISIFTMLSLHRFSRFICGTNLGGMLCFVGGFSYSLYLVHLPITFALNRIALSFFTESLFLASIFGISSSLIFSNISGYIFFVCFEKPFLKKFS